VAPLSTVDELVEVRSIADVGRVRRATRQAVERMGFDRVTAEGVVLASIELTTNILRYGGGGRLLVRTLDDPRLGPGVEIESTDVGPGIEDIGRALEDGFSTGGGLGGGLPSVKRLMDEVQIESSSSGTRVVARRWLTRS
jgi:serine/threonine-protein kinase RsbT